MKITHLIRIALPACLAASIVFAQPFEQPVPPPPPPVYVPVTGNVELPDGTPAQGVTVVAGPDWSVGAKLATRPTGEARAVTAADGKFKMQLVSGCLYALSTEHPDLVSVPVTGVTVTADPPVQPISISMRVPQILRVRVTTGIEATAVETTLRLFQRLAPAPDRGSVAQAEFEGHFDAILISPRKTTPEEQIFHVSPGNYALTADGYQSEIEVADQPEIVVSVEINVNVFAGKFSGLVIYHGEPVEGAIVRMLDAEGGTMTLPPLTTDAKGEFAGEAPQGRWVAYVTAANGMIVGIAPIRPDKTNEIVLDRAGTTTVRIVNGQGAPIANAPFTYHLRFGKASPGTSQTCGLSGEDVTDADGKIFVRGIPARTEFRFTGFKENMRMRRSFRVYFGAPFDHTRPDFNMRN